MSDTVENSRPNVGDANVVEEEIVHFEGEVARFNSGDIPAEKFQGFRLRQGVYGQRGGGGQMLRIKLPYGRIDAEQLEVIAGVGDDYAQGPAHVTTRQDFQYHFVQLEQMGDVMRDLAKADITTREACGNTVRNVTACHYAGVCSQELFDVTPYARMIHERFLRHQVTQNMPRKFKIALSGCDTDCAHTGIHDVGLIPAQKDGQYGFRLVVGGGLGSSPRVAHLFEEFVPVDEILPACEAMVRLFDLYGNRKQRSRARIKFLVERLGEDEFRRRYDEQRAKMVEEGVTFPTMPAPVPNTNVTPWPLVMPGTSGYDRWAATNVKPERNEGLSSVQLALTLGDLTTNQLRDLARLTRSYSSVGEMRLTVQQNMVFISVPNDRVRALYDELVIINLAESGAQHLTDVMSCPGAESCNLALTASRGMGTLLSTHMAANPDRYQDDGGARIKISGCPNSCGHHHIASMGFHGTAKKNDGHMAPFYEVHLGGRSGDGETIVASPTLRIPAQHGPKVVDALLDHYREQRQGGESFDAFVARHDKDHFKVLLESLTELPSYEVDPSYYQDLGADEDFALEDMGPGECAGGVLDLIEVGLKEARQQIAKSATNMEGGQTADAAANADDAVFSAAQALLVTEGVEAELVPEVVAEFTAKFVATGLMPATCATVFFALGRHASGSPDAAVVTAHLKAADDFVRLCETAYEGMGNDLRLTSPVDGGTATAAPDAPAAEAPAAVAATPDVATLDLKGVACPMNYVKTKLKLEMMPAGAELAVLLDDGEPIENVPRSVRNDGHEILSMDLLEGGQHHRIVIKKS